MAISKIGRNATDTSISDSGDATAITITSGEDIDIESGDIFFSTAGKGINLGVTSNTDSNTLDDYEEGTFNVTATIASGAFQLDDLPFTPASADEDSIHSVFYIGTDGMTGLASGGQPVMGQIIGGNTNIFIFTQDQNGFADPGNHFTDNSILRFNFSYIAA